MVVVAAAEYILRLRSLLPTVEIGPIRKSEPKLLINIRVAGVSRGAKKTLVSGRKVSKHVTVNGHRKLSEL